MHAWVNHPKRVIFVHTYIYKYIDTTRERQKKTNESSMKNRLPTQTESESEIYLFHLMGCNPKIIKYGSLSYSVRVITKMSKHTHTQCCLACELSLALILIFRLFVCLRDTTHSIHTKVRAAIRETTQLNSLPPTPY